MIESEQFRIWSKSWMPAVYIVEFPGKCILFQTVSSNEMSEIKFLE